MESLVAPLRDWFLAKREYFDAFIINDTRVESWFKAELLVLLDRLIRHGIVDSFEREPSLHNESGKRSQIDFAITVRGIKHYLELKVCVSASRKEHHGIYLSILEMIMWASLGTSRSSQRWASETSGFLLLSIPGLPMNTGDFLQAM